MDKKTEGVEILVKDVLATIPEPYGEDITLEVCIAIEKNREWKRLYDELSEELRAWVVNNAIGSYVKSETGLNRLREVTVKGKCSLITKYSKLGR
jgi:hypothetical protein